jgi:hypothetical protein
MSDGEDQPVRRLSEDDWAVLNYIEQMYHIDGATPRPSSIATVLNLPIEKVEKIIHDQLVVDSLVGRGILQDSNGFLSTDQLAGMAIFFDTKDGRSLKKKLADAGISTLQWNAWKNDPIFASALRNRAEKSLENNLAETEVALMDSAHRGDISAIKLHLELTGRWSSKTVGELNVEFLMIKILECIQRHVTDPEQLMAIAEELSALAPNTSAGPPALTAVSL